MAKKITELQAIDTVASDDQFVVIDKSDTSAGVLGTDKRATVAQVSAVTTDAVDAHSSETGGVHGVPVGESVVHTGDTVQTVATFNNVADMQADTTLTVGRRARTLGYYTPGDGGGNDYEIVAAATGTADGGSFIDLSGSDTQAKGLFGEDIKAAWFGVVSNGATDNASALQASVDFANQIGGGEIILPSGNINLDSGIVVNDAPNIKISGTTGRLSSITFTPESGSAISVINASVDFEMESVRIATSDPNVTSSAAAITFSADNPTSGKPVRPSIQNIDIDGFGIAVNNEAGGNLTMRDCYINRTWESSLILGGKDDGTGAAFNVSENYVERCRFSKNASGSQSGPQIDVKSSAALRMSWCDITGGNRNMRIAENITGDIPANVWCSNVIFGGLTDIECVFVSTGTQNANFRDCIFEAAGTRGLTIRGSARNIDIDGGMIRGNQDDGIRTVALEEGSFSIKNCRISGNNKGEGVNSEVNINDVPVGAAIIVQGCHVGGKMTSGNNLPEFGLVAGATCDGTVAFINNQIWGYSNSATSISGSATGTIIDRDNDDFGA